jgi:hypothetical protein
MTVTGDFCRQSYPMIAASFAGLSLTPPDHPRPVLIQVEDLAADFIPEGLPLLLGGLNDNLQQWKAGFAPGQTNSPSGAAYFDNLAVAGFTLEDLIGSPTQADGVSPAFGTPLLADKFLATGAPGGGPPVPTLDNLLGVGTLAHLAVNARFVLNPSNNPLYQNYSQLTWVQQRQPKNLIVNVGHNNGFFVIGSDGVTSDWLQAWDTSYGTAPALQQYLKLLATLTTDPVLANTKMIFVGLPKISAVANLMPASGSVRLASDPSYYALYQTQFAISALISGEDLKQADESVQTVNGKIKQAVLTADGGAGRLQYYDMYKFFSDHDTKNLGAPPLNIAGRMIDNTYIHGVFTTPPGPVGGHATPKWVFAGGGLQSIDGMHPTSIGYAALGMEIAAMLSGSPVSAAYQANCLEHTLYNEELVTFFPQGLEALLGLVSNMSSPNQPAAANTAARTMHGLASNLFT